MTRSFHLQTVRSRTKGWVRSGWSDRFETWRSAEVAAGRMLEAGAEGVLLVMEKEDNTREDIGVFIGYDRETREPRDFLFMTQATIEEKWAS